MNIDKIKQEIKFEEWLANYAGDDEIISSWDLKEKLAKEPIEIKFNSQIDLIDKFLESFEAGELVVVSGNTGCGKTLFCQTLTRNFEKQKNKCLWFSYEIRLRNFFQRFGEYLPLFYLPKQLTDKDVKWIEKKIWESKLKFDTQIVFIDHLGFLSDVEKQRDRRMEIDSLIRKLKLIAIRHNVLIFLMWHNKKPPEQRRNYEADENDLKESSAIAQDSDIVLMINRLSETIDGIEDWNVGRAKITIIKSRRSGIMKRSVNLRIFDGLFEEDLSLEQEVQKNKWEI